MFKAIADTAGSNFRLSRQILTNREIYINMARYCIISGIAVCVDFIIRKEMVMPMTYCPKCNLASPSCSDVCTNCGGKMSPVPTCRICGEDILPHKKTCTGCGTPRDEAIE